MRIDLTRDEAETLAGFIEYGLESGDFDYIDQEQQVEKARIINILGVLKARLK